jgi:hypothetical protein
LSKLRGLSPAGTWSGSAADQMGTMNPFQVWMQFAEQWQKASAEALASWRAAGEVTRVGSAAVEVSIASDRITI